MSTISPTHNQTVASTTLFFIAKRRQWNVRASIKRASRRLTGRPVNKRPTGYADIKSGYPVSKNVGHKRGFRMSNGAWDVEKGALPVRKEAGVGTARPREKSWVGRLWGNGWK